MPAATTRPTSPVRDPSSDVVIRLLALLGAYIALDRWTRAIADLPLEAHRATVVAVELLAEVVAPPTTLLSGAVRVGVPLALLALASSRGRRLSVTWSELPDGRVLRPIFAVPALLLAWILSTYAYSGFMGQLHGIDRVLVVALGVGALWRPILSLPLAALSLALLGQFALPLGTYSLAQSSLPIGLLLLAAAFVSVRAAGVRVQGRDLVFLSLTLLAAGYARGGLSKMVSGWPLSGQIGLMLPATYANGWLAFLRPDQVSALTATLLRLDPLLIAGTLLVEAGAIAALLRRSLLHLFLVAWVGFHLSIFVMTGILFWEWIAVELTLLLLLALRPRATALDCFAPPYAWLSVPLIAGGTLWFHPTDLSWHNAAISYAYHFEAEDGAGRRYDLPPAYFAPYDYTFTLGSFAYLTSAPRLPIVWGATDDAAIAEASRRAMSIEDVAAVEIRLGASRRDDARADVLSSFLRAHVGGRPRASPWWRFARPPHQLWTMGALPPAEVPLSLVRVREVTSMYAEGRYRDVRSRIVHVVRIDGGPS